VPAEDADELPAREVDDDLPGDDDVPESGESMAAAEAAEEPRPVARLSPDDEPVFFSPTPGAVERALDDTSAPRDFLPSADE
jgi:hypothetical protein